MSDMVTERAIDRARLLAFNDGGEAGACAAVDWLQEQGATLSDLLGLYAGRGHGDALSDYLAEEPRDDEGLRLVVASWCRAAGPSSPARWQAVRDCGPYLEGEAVRESWLLDSYGGWWGMDPVVLEREVQDFRARLAECIRVGCGGPFPEHILIAAARTRRAQKRAVLALFPDVTVERQAELWARRIARLRSGQYLSAEFDHVAYRAAALREPAECDRLGGHTRWQAARPLVLAEERDVPCVVTQVLPAPVLIPPDAD